MILTYRLPLQIRADNYESVTPDTQMLNSFNSIVSGYSIIYPEFETKITNKIENIIKFPLCYVCFETDKPIEVDLLAKELKLKKIKTNSDLPTSELKAKFDKIIISLNMPKTTYSNNITELPNGMG